MAGSDAQIDAIRLESRLSAIETKLSDGSLRDRVVFLEREVRDSSSSLTRIDTSLKHLPSEKDVSDLLQRLARLETRVAHLPSKGFIVTAVSAIGALLTVVTSFEKLRSALGL